MRANGLLFYFFRLEIKCSYSYCQRVYSSRPITWLSHWDRAAHICVSKLIIIGSDNGLSPGWRQTIIWTNAGILLIEPQWTKFSKILIEIQTFSFKKMHLKTSSAKWRLFCRGLKVLHHENREKASKPPIGHIYLVKKIVLTSQWCTLWGVLSNQKADLLVLQSFGNHHDTNWIETAHVGHS